MTSDRKLRACFITALLLFSSLSILVVFPDNAKAQSPKETDFYFHDKNIEEEIGNIDFINDVLFNEMYSQINLLIKELGYNSEADIFNNITDGEAINTTLILKIVNYCLSHPKTIWYLSGLAQLLGEEYTEESDIDYNIKVLDINRPTKTNLSKYPSANLETIINALTGGDAEDIDFASLFDVITSLAPLPIAYEYHGESPVTLDGDIKFTLYFERSLSYIWNKDTFTVSFYIYDPEEYFINISDKYNASKSLTIDRLDPENFIHDPAEYEVVFSPEETITLNPNDIILIQIERDAGDKLILENLKDEFGEAIDLSNIAETLETWGEALQSIPIDSIKEIGDQLVNASEGLYNITDMINESDFVELFYNLIVEVISSAFIYDSLYYQSYVSIPGYISEEPDDNIKIYYLHGEDDEKTLNENEPTKEEPFVIDLKTSTGIWNSSAIGMSKILKGASMGLHLNYRDLIKFINILRGKIKVNADIYAGEKLVASAEKELDRTTVFDLFDNIGLSDSSNEAIMFNFTVVEKDQEITYDTPLSLSVYVTNETKFGLGIYRDIKLLYDSKDNPSFLIVEFDETENIKMSVDGPDKIAAGESAHYILTINSKYNDNISLSYTSKGSKGDWAEIELPEDPIQISADGYTIVDVFINSTAQDISAYDDPADFIKVDFEASGLTGKAVENVTVTISDSEVEYNVEFEAPKEMEIKRGKSGTYKITFINKNTGLMPDDYEVEARSSHGWNVEIIGYNASEGIINIDPNEEVELSIRVDVPKHPDTESDVLKIIVNSTNGEKTFMINMTTIIPKLSLTEAIYDFFDSVAESLGLDSILGDYAGAFLIFIFIFIILIFIILGIYLASKKFVQIVCLDRVKEIPPDSYAEFGISIHNPSNQRLTYEAYIDTNSSPGWEASLDTNSVIIEPKQSHVILLTVKPTDLVKPKDWIETKVVVRVVEKHKMDSLSTITSITDEKPDLKIIGVLHWPKAFKKGDRVTTSFKLENKGKVSAENITVILYVNGEEKNKVENITIPSGGYADIELPWIAVKGKNDIDIVVK